MPGRDVIAIGGSAGGLAALKSLVAGLPADLPATLLVVLHTRCCCLRTSRRERRCLALDRSCRTVEPSQGAGGDAFTPTTVAYSGASPAAVIRYAEAREGQWRRTTTRGPIGSRFQLLPV